VVVLGTSDSSYLRILTKGRSETHAFIVRSDRRWVMGVMDVEPIAIRVPSPIMRKTHVHLPSTPANSRNNQLEVDHILIAIEN
jgi:hypothetical protein